ncbi:opioid growth factor receptor-like [Lampris incognitus]|uniref:opioid growth factor receptor-like n=1 Tax=Lampris incognitus TaxID=2546036 RepID=UPI0024B5D5BC|nr:opioid growth factor receptor-like [Lampris incognitus]
MSILRYNVRLPSLGRLTFWNYLSAFNLRPRRCLTAVAVGIVGTLWLWYKTRKPPGVHDEARPSDGDPEEVLSEVVTEKSDSDSVSEGPKNGKRAADCSVDIAESQKRPRTEEEDSEESDGSECAASEDDDFSCEYDSTWETSSPTAVSHRTDRRESEHRTFWIFKHAARDMQNYRHDYTHKPARQHWNQKVRVEGDDMANLNFYLGKTPSAPDGVFIDEFHSEWYGKYNKLERVHTFIQWLFPLQEPGVNKEARELTKREIKAFLEHDIAKENLLKSYKLMLDFYGIELSNEGTGEVQRASNWEERFGNLNSNTHNNLRITRILKCLGTLGFSHYQAPLVQFFLEETLEHGNLPDVKESVLNYFLFAVLDRTERRKLLKYAFLNYEPKEEFVWCPKKIQLTWTTKAGIPYPTQPLQATVQDYCEDGYSSNTDYV